MKKQAGFAIVEAVLIVVILAGLGGAGYVVWHRNHHKTTSQTATTSSTTNSPASTAVPTAPQIKTSSDLNTALQTLNQTNLSANNADSSSLNTQASAF